MVNTDNVLYVNLVIKHLVPEGKEYDIHLKKNPISLKYHKDMGT